MAEFNDFGDGDDSGEHDIETDISLDSIEHSKTINYSIRANYTTWKPREAFRELVQNWRDAILQTFDIQARDFRVTREQTSSGRKCEVLYKTTRKKPDGTYECLGYIRFKGRDGLGTIEITNRAATLLPWHMDLGGTSKRGKAEQAGAHGEGLKIALLVLMRGSQNHSIRCRSGGFNWTFNFTNRGRLVARLHRMTPQAIQNLKNLTQQDVDDPNTLLSVVANPTEDVQLILGEPRNGRDDTGDRVRRDPVKRQEFDAWIRCALFLSEIPDGAIIPTADGDLITDPLLRGNIYLKGLLLHESNPGYSASVTGKPLMFGYNFASGATNRERMSVSSHAEESMFMFRIWNRVLRTKPELVKHLSEMLNSEEPAYADVLGAERHLLPETAARLKDYLCGSSFSRRWYYSAREKSKNPRLDRVIEGLDRKGVQLTDRYWKLLHKHHLIHTAAEEEHKRFMTAPLAMTPDTAFATAINSHFSACLQACPYTKDMTAEFIQAGQLRLALFFASNEGKFRIHQRYLSLDNTVAELGLPQTVEDMDIKEHVLRQLMTEALYQLPLESFRASASNAQTLKTPEDIRDIQIRLAEQRLIESRRLQESNGNGAAKRLAHGDSSVKKESDAPDAFEIKKPLQNLDILAYDSDRWYEAKGPRGVRAVIGIAKGQERLPQESRKRRREMD